jgi:hypothetical protein
MSCAHLCHPPRCRALTECVMVSTRNPDPARRPSGSSGCCWRRPANGRIGRVAGLTPPGCRPSRPAGRHGEMAGWGRFLTTSSVLPGERSFRWNRACGGIRRCTVGALCDHGHAGGDTGRLVDHGWMQRVGRRSRRRRLSRGSLRWLIGRGTSVRRSRRGGRLRISRWIAG